ncbi:MAG: ankyrin repeat domain-containing protein [Treponema sp.]
MKNSLFLIFGLLHFAFLFTSCCSAPPLISDNLLDCDTVKYPGDVNIKFFNAAKSGDAITCKEQLTRHANINASDRIGQSALMWAAWQGSDEVVKCLLEFDKDIREKTKNNKKKKRYIHLLEYSTESKPKYNPLFSLLMAHGMQVPNTIECINLLLENEEKFSKKATLLTKEDMLQENVLHKVVRSGVVEYLELFLEKLKPVLKDDFTKFINAENSSGESPLMLAVKEKNSEMVRILIEKGADILIRDREGRSLSILAFDDGKGDYETYLEIMKARLRFHIKEREERKKEAKKPFTYTYSRVDNELKVALEDYSKRLRRALKGDHFDLTYRRFADKEHMVEDPEDLVDENYKNKKNDFFALLIKNNMSERDIDVIKELIKENPFLLECGYERVKGEPELYALHIAIEQRNEYLFNAIFSLTDMNRIKRSNKYADYLHCAIENDNPIVIRKLLEYNKNPTGITGHLIENLMSPHHTNPNPINQYLRHDDLRKDLNLFGDILSYYRVELKSNSSLPNYVFTEALRHDNEELLLFLYDRSMPKTQFYTSEFEEGTRRYLQFVFLEKGFFKALKLFIKNSMFFESKWDTVKDKKNNDKLFEELLNEMERTEEVDEIIKVYEKEKELRGKSR